MYSPISPFSVILLLLLFLFFPHLQEKEAEKKNELDVTFSFTKNTIFRSKDNLEETTALRRENNSKNLILLNQQFRIIIKNVSSSKKCKIKNVYLHKNGYYSVKFYITYMLHLAITGSGILSDFQIIL